MRAVHVASAVAVVAGAAVAAIVVTRTGDERPRLVTFGHSIVAGIGNPARPWPPRVAERLAVPLENRGVGGAEAPDLARVVRAYRPRPGDVAVVQIGINDVLRHGLGGLPAFRAGLGDALSRLSRGLGSGRVACAFDAPIAAWRGTPFTGPSFDRGSDEALAAYRRVAREIADARGVRFVDLGEGWDLADVVDGLHPDERGTQAIADRLAPVVEDLLRAAVARSSAFSDPVR